MQPSDVRQRSTHVFTHRGITVRLCPESMSSSIHSAAGEKCCSALDRPNPESPQMPVATIVLMLSQACNLRCKYCYGDGGSFGSKGLMSHDIAVQAVDWLVKHSGAHKTLRVGFMGGEPLMNFEVLRTATLYTENRAAQEGKTASFYTTTNGTLLDGEKISFLRKHNIRVQVSLDGPQEVHDHNRPFANGQGSWKVVTEQIHHLLAECPSATGHAVLTGGTKSEIVRRSLKDAGFRDFSILPATASLFGNVNAHTEENDAVLEEYLSLVASDAEEWLIAIRDRDVTRIAELSRTTSLAWQIRALLYGIKKRFGCGAGLGMVGVGIDGFLYPCQRFVGQAQYRIGHIHDGLPERGIHLDSALAHSEECSICFARYTCTGGCKHDNASSSGHVYSPSVRNCKLRKRELELAAWIVAQLTPEDRAFAATTESFPAKPCPLDL